LKIGQKVVAVDERYFRPTEVDLLIGEATKAKSELGWEPSIGLNELVNEMVNADYLKISSN
jgi:GDPmannose 4,6-dehydratase